jgi:hypothetical protein
MIKGAASGGPERHNSGDGSAKLNSGKAKNGTVKRSVLVRLSVSFTGLFFAPEESAALQE